MSQERFGGSSKPGAFHSPWSRDSPNCTVRLWDSLGWSLVSLLVAQDPSDFTHQVQLPKENFIPHKPFPMLSTPNPRSATDLASLLLQHFINMHSSMCSRTYLASYNFISSSTPSTSLHISPPEEQGYPEMPGMGHREA